MAILKIEVNARNNFKTINSLAMDVITYSFNIINWVIYEIKNSSCQDMEASQNTSHAPVKNRHLPKIQLQLSLKTATMVILLICSKQMTSCKTGSERQGDQKLNSIIQLREMQLNKTT